MKNQAAQIARTTMEMEIAAPAEKVWKALTDDIGKWWPAEFYAGGEVATRNFAIETWPGGRMFETWESGGGVLWATVVCIDPAVRLQVLGTSFPNWGGPSQWYGTWDLAVSENGTMLKFSESTIGRISEDGAADNEKGWQFLCNTLKAHVEGSPAPEW